MRGPAITADPVWGWVALLVGVVTGAGLLVGLTRSASSGSASDQRRPRPWVHGCPPILAYCRRPRRVGFPGARGVLGADRRGAGHPFRASGGTSGTAGSGAPVPGPADQDGATADGAFFDASTVHSIAIEVDDTALRTMLQTFVDTGDKEWISGTVTVDGQAFDDVGIKLKGNSSLKGVTADSAAELLPWRIRLDKFVDGQNLEGEPTSSCAATTPRRRSTRRSHSS